MPAIETRDLKKSYFVTQKTGGFKGLVKSIVSPDKKEIEAVKGINLSIESGEVVGFLGPNGAGKTTTLKMLSGILYPTAGSCSVLGFTPTDRNPDMLKQMSLVMGNKQQLWWDLPAWDSFLVFRELYEIDHKVFDQRIEALIEALQIKDKVNTQVRRLSLGERMKCELVAALLYAPKVLFLDEPTLGLDVVSQKRIREFLSEMHKQEGTTILLTSHYMQDVEQLCDRVVVIDKGVVMFDNTLHALSSHYGDSRRIRLSFANPVAAEDLTGFGKLVGEAGETATLDVSKAEIPTVTGALLSRFPVIDLAIEETDIEDVIREMFASNAKA